MKGSQRSFWLRHTSDVTSLSIIPKAVYVHGNTRVVGHGKRATSATLAPLICAADISQLASSRHWSDVAVMLGRRRRRWPDITSTSAGQCLVIPEHGSGHYGSLWSNPAQSINGDLSLWPNYVAFLHGLWLPAAPTRRRMVYCAQMFRVGMVIVLVWLSM